MHTDLVQEPQVEKHESKECGQFLMAIRDSMDVLSGKWKVPILGALFFEKKRFKELQRDVKGITAKVLAKELRDLEVNELITRTVYNTMPVSVEYEMTDYGRSLEKVFNALTEWGVEHRIRMTKETRDK